MYMIFGAILILAFVAFAALAWRNLKLALVLLCGLTPTYLVRFTVGPVPSTMLEGFLVIAIGVFIIQHHSVIFSTARGLQKYFTAFRMTNRGIGALSLFQKLYTAPYIPPLARGGNTLIIPLLFIALASVAAVIIAPDQLSALGIWKAYYIEPFLFGLMIWTLFERENYRNAFLVLAASGLVVALFAIIQVLFHVGIPDAWATENRATSFFPYPNAVGLLLAPMVSWMVVNGRWNMEDGKSPELRLPRTIFHFPFSIFLFIIAIGLAKTEAALVAIPAALYLVVMITPMISRRKKILATSGVVIATTLIFAFFPNIALKLTLQDSSGLVRRAQWSETLHLLADHPYLGVGLNGYPTALVPYHDATTYEIFQYPHNVLLNVWSELGIFGFIGFIGLIGYCIGFAWQHREDSWTLACFAALLTMLIHGLVDVPFMKNDLAIVSVLFFVGMIRKKKKA